MYHYFSQMGHIPGIPGIFGAGQVIETDEACTSILSVRPFLQHAQQSVSTSIEPEEEPIRQKLLNQSHSQKDRTEKKGETDGHARTR